MSDNSSDNDDDFSLRDRGAVLLGLGLRDDVDGKSAARFSRDLPSDQELQAFVEHRLTDKQRSFVLKAIANDRSVYQRWLSFVEIAHAEEHLDQAVQNFNSAHAGQPSSSTPGLTISQRIKQWLRPVIVPVGTVAASALMLLMLFPGGQSMEADVTALYEAYGESARLALKDAENLPTRSTSGLIIDADLSYSEDKTALAQGIEAGLAELGSAAALPGGRVERQWYASTNELDSSDRSTLYQLGRLSLLTYASCQPALDQDLYRKLQPAFHSAVSQLKSAEYPVLRGANTIYESVAADTSVFSPAETCAIAVSLIGQFSNE